MSAGAWLQVLWWLLLVATWVCIWRVRQHMRSSRRYWRAIEESHLATLRSVRSVTMYRAAARWMQEGGDPVVGAWMGALGDLYGQDERTVPATADPFEILGFGR